MRPRPELWLRLPVEVVDAPTLAAHLHQWVTDPAHPAFPIIRSVADQVAGCAPRDAAALRRIVDASDAAMRAADTAESRRYWESVAHAVDRVADVLDPATTSAP